MHKYILVYIYIYESGCWFLGLPIAASGLQHVRVSAGNNLHIRY